MHLLKCSLKIVILVKLFNGIHVALQGNIVLFALDCVVFKLKNCQRLVEMADDVRKDDSCFRSDDRMMYF